MSNDAILASIADAERRTTVRIAKRIKDLATDHLDWDVIYGHEQARPEVAAIHETAGAFYQLAEDLLREGAA